jgi:hypothetical protein
MRCRGIYRTGHGLSACVAGEGRQREGNKDACARKRGEQQPSQGNNAKQIRVRVRQGKIIEMAREARPRTQVNEGFSVSRLITRPDALRCTLQKRLRRRRADERASERAAPTNARTVKGTRTRQTRGGIRRTTNSVASAGSARRQIKLCGGLMLSCSCSCSCS